MSAPIPGLCVTVNEGGPIPTPAQIASFLPWGGTIRDVLGWHQVERSRGAYAIPPRSAALYAAVAQTNGSNLVTLAFGNPLYGGGPTSFPVEIDPTGKVIRDASAAFARYAAFVCASVPNLAAVSLYNEVNGDFDRGSPAAREAEYAVLCRAVVPAIRAVNPGIPIIAGASAGWNIDGWFIHLNTLFPLSQVDYIDIHPYFGLPKLAIFAQQMAQIRKHGITNPAWYTEHGASIAVNLGAGYWPLLGLIMGCDTVPVMGENYFLLQTSGKFHSGLLDTAGAMTLLGASR